ncbi:MAG: hypothetical protein WKF78_02025 [Candidatus Limnocylindrales bacterium]
MRMITLSILPPKNPAMAPSGTPIATITTTAMKPMKSEVCSAFIRRRNMSCPIWFVPSGWARFWKGGRIVADRLVLA